MSFAAPLRAEFAQAAPKPSVTPALTALRCCRYFANWSQASLAQIALASSLRSFSAGQQVVAEGRRLDYAIAIVRGRLRAVRRADKGREVTLEIHREGSLVVDALLDAQAVMPNDLVASETTLILFVPREVLLVQIRQNPDAMLALARDLERRLATAKASVASLVLSDVEARLRETLVRLAQEEGEAVAEGLLIRRSPTQQELGTMIGACRETVSRIVADFARRGLLTLHGRKLTLSPTLCGAPAEAEAVAGSA
ncbi:MAG: Crp/Fnr family transcriptional regulator [Armatimonadota bacterium]|nr:Crp/Fnr family transcriptional regulator [Armatimonadota bacterium]